MTKLISTSGVPLDFAVLLRAMERNPQPSLEYINIVERINQQDFVFENNENDKWLSGLLNCFGGRGSVLNTN